MAKICFIELQPFPTTIGGGITHLNELSKELIKMKQDVSIITSKPEGKFKLDKGLEKLNLYHVGLKHKKLDNYKGISKIYYYLWRVFFEFSFIIAAKKILKNESFDIIDSQSPITTSLPCSLSNKEFYITAHGVHHEGFSKLYKSKKNLFVLGLGGLLYRRIEKYNVKRAKRIICLGKNTYDYYKKFNDCVVIPNGIDVDKFSPKKGGGKKIIISVGRLTEQKAIDKLILAMDKLPDYKLEIIGLGDLEEQVKKLCSQRKNCEFLGYKTQEEIIPYLRRARFTVFPSLFEGLPISMLEAMSCGVIPISTKVGDIPSLIKEGINGFFLKNNNSDEIIKTLRDAEKKDLKKISARCSMIIKNEYSWKKIAERFMKAWQIKN